ncbi:MAG: hypothetical protein KF760_28855 [Candidatus Eremiobacteraeota bacterium]|nr:hypothetical protein [Candidatus Eremiobacteraeota bacterium]MCW5865908.1 hypothetical protein [Candidatus Eremiobacteraeota bacterium]
MTIQGSLQFFQSSFSPRVQHCQPHYHQAPMRACQPSPWTQLAQMCQCQDYSQQLGSVWASVMRPEGPSLSQPQEMSRNQSTQVGAHTMQVDGQGNISVNTAPTQVAMGGSCGNAAFAANFSKQDAPLKFSNGTVELPNGEKRPYGNTGIIVVMADGRQFAAGRNSKDSNENIRYVAADKGQEIPVSPPGNTTVLYLDEGGNVARQETR